MPAFYRKPMLLVRLASAVYWLVLTAMLLLPDPWALLGMKGPVDTSDKSDVRVVHFLLFTGLTVLVHAGRWPVRRGLLVGLLLAYAIGTESSQAFIPMRTVDPIDFLENLLGIAAGVAVWRFIERRRTNGRRGASAANRRMP